MSLAGNLAFGSVEVGGSRDATLTITNGSSTPINVTGLSVSAGLSQHLAATPTSGQVPGRGTLPVTIRFSPQSAGAFSGTITVNSDQTAGTNTIAFSGTGIAPALTLFGVVSDANTGRPVPGVRVSVRALSGTTDGNGYYSIPSVDGGALTVTYSAAGYNPQTSTFTALADTRRDIRLVPFWRQTGTGNTVFDMPTSVSRVRVRGYYPSRSSNFVVRIGGRLVVNELLGTSWSSQRYDGLHATSGGAVEITLSRDVQWELIQEQ